MPLTKFRGRDVFEYDGRRYDFFGKPFEKLVNRLRKVGKRLFEEIDAGFGAVYVVNPLLSGKGSSSPIIKIDTTTKAGAQQLARITKAWEELKYFVRKGKEYHLQMDLQYTIVRSLKNGMTLKQIRQSSLPAMAMKSTLPNEFTNKSTFKPKQDMTRDEVVKFMQELLQQVLSADYDQMEATNIKTLKLSATPVSGVPLMDIPMGSIRMLYSAATGIDNNASARPGECVRDYIMRELAKPDSRRVNFTRSMLPRKLNTTREIIEWAKTEDDVSVHALDPMMRTFAKHQATEKTRVCLMFVVNNEHCYPIMEAAHRKQIAACGRLELKPLELKKVDYSKAMYCLCSKDDENAMMAFIEAADRAVVLPVASLEKIAARVMDETQTLIDTMQYYDSCLRAFLHPTKQVMVIAGDDFAARRAVCDAYFAENRIVEYEWANQSWGEIGRLIQDGKFGKVAKGHYSSDWKRIFERYPIRPYRMCENKRATGVRSVDIHRCYTSILQLNDAPYAVPSAFDVIKPFTFTSVDRMYPGEYYVARDFYMGNGAIYQPASWYPLVQIKHAITQGYIDGSDITMQQVADRHLPAHFFRALADEMYEKHADAKLAVNSYIGCLGSLYDRSVSAATTTDFDTAMATIAEMPQAVVNQVNDLFIIQRQTEAMKDTGSHAIYRHIVAAGVCALDNMILSLGLKAGQIVACNTDSVKYVGYVNDSVVRTKGDCKPGQYCFEPVKCLNGRTISELPRPEPYTLPTCSVEVVSEADADWIRVMTRGGIITGGGGCGKTHALVRCYLGLPAEERKDTAVLTYMNTAAQNLRSRRAPAKTLSSLLFDGTTEGLNVKPLQKFKRIIIDEFSMVPQKELGAVISVCKAYNIPLIAVGDPNQCKAPVDNWVAYEKNRLFMEACGSYIVQMQYKSGFARYDESLYETLQRFLRTKKLDIECSEVESFQNICYTNDMRRSINARCLERWVREHGAKLTKFGFPVALGLPVMCYNGKDADQDVFKTQVWTVNCIGIEHIVLKRDELGEDGMTKQLNAVFDAKTFKALFDYAFAFTVHKVQGITIDGHYNIYEGEHMTADVMYTALSRGTKLDHVHVVSKRTDVYRDPWRVASVALKMSVPDVKRGRIYKITLSNGMVYVGKTERSLTERFQEHLETPTNAVMAEHMNTDAYMELLDEFNYVEKATFDAIEQRYIAATEAEGYVMANKQHIKKVEKVEKRQVETKQRVIPIAEDASKQRYEVRLRRKGVDAEDQVKRFPWCECKETAFAAAQEHVEYLAHKYF